jgi:hypothetical protein
MITSYSPSRACTTGVQYALFPVEHEQQNQRLFVSSCPSVGPANLVCYAKFCAPVSHRFISQVVERKYVGIISASLNDFKKAQIEYLSNIIP